jgi:hypothetical protein
MHHSSYTSTECYRSVDHVLSIFKRVKVGYTIHTYTHIRTLTHVHTAHVHNDTRKRVVEACMYKGTSSLSSLRT